MAPSPVVLVLVDFDDTLVDTAPRFQNARRSLFSVLSQHGITAEMAQRIHHERVDPLMMERHGLGPFRLEHSFRATYEESCSELALPIVALVAEQCAALGRAVAGTPPPFDGALDALRTLCARHPTVIYTQAGDHDYQSRCVQEAGVAAIVGAHAVHICARKTVAAFRATLETFQVAHPAGVWMIGNSMRSDINPALEAGARAILVEMRDPWEFDLVEPVSHDYVRAASFVDAVNYLLRLDETCT
ncbi:MAG: HAD family hydrolase [Longimicrobiales bacterium]